jgi:hypothetical protein
MFVCTTVLYEYMNSLKNDGNNLLGNTPVLIKIYQEFYHSIANEGVILEYVIFMFFLLK